jgi:hypothetical protein
VAESLKVPKKQFENVIRALLKAPPMPMATISPKRPKAKSAKKR